jgi:hypothetical protein
VRSSLEYVLEKAYRDHDNMQRWRRDQHRRQAAGAG